jgi:putative addiction module component (TIGR02574 family)
MTRHAADLLAEALRLTEEERGELAARLIESLDTAAEDEVEVAWSAQIQQRLADLQSGQVSPVPWPEARRMILEDTD